MQNKIATPFSMSDKDIITFQYDADGNLLVEVGEHNDQLSLMTFIFKDLLAVKYQVPDAGVQGFIEETGSNEFLENSLQYGYWDGTPVKRDDIKLFQFLEIDNNPIMEVIARSVDFINHFPEHSLSRKI